MNSYTNIYQKRKLLRYRFELHLIDSLQKSTLQLGYHQMTLKMCEAAENYMKKHRISTLVRYSVLFQLYTNSKFKEV